AAFATLVAATIGIAWRTESATAAVPAAAVLVALVMADWSTDFQITRAVGAGGLGTASVSDIQREAIEQHLALGGGFAVLFGVVGLLVQGRSQEPWPPILWAASAVFAPIAILIALYYRASGFDRSIPFAAFALALAAFYVVATEFLSKRPPRPG